MSTTRLLRSMILAGMTATLTLAVAWAGVGLAPTGTGSLDPATVTVTGPGDPARASANGNGNGNGSLDPGEVYVGAAKVSIEPDPDAYDAHWEKEGCGTDLDYADDLRTPFPTHPDCIYMWGIGTGTPILGWDDDYGLWARSVAISDGEETVVLTMLDGFSWFAYYNNFCDDCGALQLAEELAAAHGFDPAGFFLHSSHSHAAPDFIGSGGGVAEWYMQQVADSIRESVGSAIAAMQPATVEAGEEMAREFNNERRDTYYAAEEAGLSWFRALDRDGDVIATVGAYAAHPVTFGTNGRVAHADWPALFVARLEERFGGLGFFFQTGLGNMSASGSHIPEPRRFIGVHLANLIPESGEGTSIGTPEVRAARTVWNQPYTNIAIGALGVTGVFDRAIGGPAAISVGRHEARPCHAVSPVSVRTSVNAARIGTLTITGGPGELFSNLTNVIKERSAGGITLPLGQINDGLGYIMQEFEADYVYGQRTLEYEETFGSACFGEAVLEFTLDLLAEIR